MEHQYDQRYCWHDNAEYDEGFDDYEPEGKQNYRLFNCPDCGYSEFKEW